MGLLIEALERRPEALPFACAIAEELAMRGAPAKAIQELAGHQDLTTTQRCMHLSPAAVDAAIGLIDELGPAKAGHYYVRQFTNLPIH